MRKGLWRLYSEHLAQTKALAALKALLKDPPMPWADQNFKAFLAVFREVVARDVKWFKELLAAPATLAREKTFQAAFASGEERTAGKCAGL